MKHLCLLKIKNSFVGNRTEYMGNTNPEFAHLRNCFINVFSNDMTTPTNSQTVKSDQQNLYHPIGPGGS